MKQFLQNIAILGILACCVFSCSEYTPKPKGYFRIDFPKNKEHVKFEEPNYPFSFEYPSIAKVIPTKKREGKDSFWVDVVYPSLNAKIYCSYKTINGNFQEIAEDSRTFVYKHTVKADGITEQPYENAKKHVYGIFYELKGNTASNFQFILTDSTKHFFRGALYFNAAPNKDSIAPVCQYVREDIIKLIESFEWKE